MEQQRGETQKNIVFPSIYHYTQEYFPEYSNLHLTWQATE